MLTKEQYQQLKHELDTCDNPLMFHDDDPDGLSAFLIFYRYLEKGHGHIVKTHPQITEEFLKKIEEYGADKVFVLDIAKIDQDFLDKCPVPVIWLDHHGPYERKGVKYFNPRLQKKDSNIPTTYMAYHTVHQDLWIATLGSVADYVIPDYLEEFRKEYPDLIEDKQEISDLYFDTKLGKLIKAFSFCLKGKTSDVKKNIKILTRINSPYEILNQETAQGKYIWKQFQKLNKRYEQMLERATKQASDDEFLIFRYSDDTMSFTGDISNELLHLYPDKFIIVGRDKDGEVRMSLRSHKRTVPEQLQQAFSGLEGNGGGHEHACGANVKQDDFDQFLKQLKAQYD